LYFAWGNNKVIFPKYIIEFNGDLTNINIPLRIEGNEIICDTDNDLYFTKQILDKNNITYSVEDIIITEEIINKTKDVVYKNSNEIYDHIENNIEPESIKKARLEQENIDLKLRLQQTEDVLLALMFGS